MNDLTATPAGRIVVGVDGSTTGQQALTAAAAEARSRHAQLDVVHAWHTVYAVSPIGAVAVPSDDHDQKADAEATLDLCIRDAFAGSEPPERLEKILVHEHNAARALIEAAKGADLLVVGSRGLGGFAGLLLGSVSQQVVHHAPMPRPRRAKRPLTWAITSGKAHRSADAAGASSSPMPNRWFRFRWPANFEGDPVKLGERAQVSYRPSPSDQPLDVARDRSR